MPGLLLWRVFHAIGLATFSTAAAFLAADLAPPGRRGTTMGVFGLAQAAALTVGPGIGRTALATLGYRGLFLAAAGTALSALVCVLVLPASTFPDARQVGVSRGRGWALWDVASVPAALQFAASIAYGTIISFIAVVARERALDAVGVFFALLALSSLGVRLVAGKAYDKWGPVAVLAPAFVALVGGIILLAVTEGPRLFLLASVLAGLGIGGSHTTLISLVVDRAPGRNRASSVAGFAACWELGVGGGTIIMGRLAAALGFQVMFLVAAALPLLGLAGLRRLRDREEEGAQAPK